MEEIWKDIPGIDGYQVSNIGRIKSFIGKEPYILQSQYSHKRKNQVVIRGIDYDVRNLMLTAFVGPPKPWDVFEYINGITNDNRIENLRWMNIKDKADKYHNKQL